MAEKMNIPGETPPEKIQEDIARTRREMSGTVSEIQEKLSASRLKEEAQQRVRGKVKNVASKIGQGARETGETIMDTVRNNPLPIAMMGVGFAWLLFNKTYGNGQAVRETRSAIREKAGDLTEKAQEKVGELSSQFRERGSELTGRAKESAVSFSRAARQQAQRATTRFQQMVQDNPLGMAFAACAIGAVIGLSIPETRKEMELMGSASETVLEKAKETAQKTIRKAQHAAERAVESAQAELKKTA